MTYQNVSTHMEKKGTINVISERFASKGEASITREVQNTQISYDDALRKYPRNKMMGHLFLGGEHGTHHQTS